MRNPQAVDSVIGTFLAIIVVLVGVIVVLCKEMDTTNALRDGYLTEILYRSQHSFGKIILNRRRFWPEEPNNGLPTV